MVSIARKNLLSEKTRLAITVGGVGLSIMLIVVLWSLYQGWMHKITLYIDSVPADFWVVQEGAADMSHGFSAIPSDVGAKIATVPGVAQSRPLLGRQLTFRVGNDDVLMYLIGYHVEDGVGGPVEMASGRRVAGAGEIVVDRVAARKHGIHVGDVLDVVGHPLHVVGISAGGDLLVFQFAFVSYEQAQVVLQSPEIDNFYLVRLASGADASQVKAGIGALPGIEAIPKNEFRDFNRRLIDQAFLPIVLVLVGIGVVVGVAVIALTIYTATIEKTREYGVLRAIGASDWKLYRVILEQAVLAGIAGWILGVGLSFLALSIMGRVAPSFISEVRAIDLGYVFVLAVVMAGFASYVPVRRLLKIDPAVVFKQ